MSKFRGLIRSKFRGLIRTIEGKTYLGFKPDIWAMLDHERIEELTELAKEELKNYYASLSPFSLRDALQKVMNEYGSARSEAFAGHPLGELMRVKIPEGISTLPFIDHRYKVHGSVGQGNWARVPWIAIMDKQETETMQDGIYVVYLFAEDMQTVYLTLNQGVTRPLQERGRKEGYQFLQQRAEQMRSELPLERMVKNNDIYLTQTGLGSDYQISTIAYFKYERDNLPDNEQLISDLKHVIDNYRLYLDQNHNNNHSQGTNLVREEHKRYDDEQIGEMLSHIQSYILSKGFYYSDRFIENFYLSLKTKPFVILAGISGTGKTKLVELFAEAMGATEDNGRFSLIPVRPDWSDPSDLLGYVDLQGEFRPGPLTGVLQDALRPENRDKPYFVCLDEMNLARVEHYFSDLLSVMETRKWDEGNQAIVTHQLLDSAKNAGNGTAPQDLYIPDNVYIIGTVNMDETTHPFSKKVLDRANTIELNEVNLEASLDFYTQDTVERETAGQRVYGNSFLKSDYLILKDAFTEENEPLIRRTVQKLSAINGILAGGHLQVGFRVRDEILFYMLYNDRFQLMPEQEALDFQIMQKILPRIQGSSINIKRILVELFNRLGTTNLSAQDHELYDQMKLRVEANPPYRRSLSKLAEMVRRFEEDGFTSFWMA